MKSNVFKKILSVSLAAVFFMSQVPEVMPAAEAAYDDAFPLPELTGRDCEDLIAVALSQEGYSASEDNDSVYWNWAGGVGSSKNWCSEFVAWCAAHADIPEDIIPKKWSSSGYRDFFAGKGQFFTIKGGCSEQGCECAGCAAETISPTEIRTGDLLLTETDGDYSNGPDHTCIAWKIENGVLYTIDGNAKLGNAYGSVKIRERDLAKKAGTFHGVCRPQYKTVPDPAPEESFDLSDIVDHTDPIDGGFLVKRKKSLELKTVYKKDTADLVENVEYEVTIGKKRIKNAVFEKKAADDAGNTCTRLSFKGKKKGKVEIVFSITLVNGQQLTQSFSGKVK